MWHISTPSRLRAGMMRLGILMFRRGNSRGSRRADGPIPHVSKWRGMTVPFSVIVVALNKEEGFVLPYWSREMS